MKQTHHLLAGVGTLTDQDLIAATRHWQTRRCERMSDAERVVWLYEDEMNRRFGGTTTVKSPLGSDERREAKPWWRFW